MHYRFVKSWVSLKWWASLHEIAGKRRVSSIKKACTEKKRVRLLTSFLSSTLQYNHKLQWRRMLSLCRYSQDVYWKKASKRHIAHKLFKYHPTVQHKLQWRRMQSLCRYLQQVCKGINLSEDSIYAPEMRGIHFGAHWASTRRRLHQRRANRRLSRRDATPELSPPKTCLP